MEFEIKGLEGLEKTFEEAGKDIDKSCKKVINRVSGIVKAKAIMLTPVAKENGGKLRRNWHFKTKNSLEGIVYNNTEYALHVEHGHRTRQGTGKNPKLNGKTFIDGRYMLTKALEETSDEMEDIVFDMFDKLFK